MFHFSLATAIIAGIFFLLVALAMSGWIFKEGKVNLTRSRAIYGKPAHTIAILILLYVPVSVAIIYLINVSGRGVVERGNKDLVIAGVVQVGVCVLLVFLLIAGVIAGIFSEIDAAIWRPRKRQPRTERPPRRRQLREDEIEEMEEERHRRRRSRRDEDDDSEHRPRRHRD